MKKALYIILLLAELVVGILLLCSAWMSIGWIPCVSAVAVCIALLVWQIVRLKKNSDPVNVHKIKRNIALIMLIPMALYIGMVLWLVIVLLGTI